MRPLHTALLLAFLLPVTACATFGSQDTGDADGSAGDGEARTLVIEVSHTLAREGAVVIWLSREGERWARELGRIIPPSTRAFQVELDDPENTWVLAAARATQPRVPVLTSRSFIIEQDAERIFWDLTSNIVRMR